MYPIDRRAIAFHIYQIVKSLRKTATLICVSHSTVARWLKNPARNPYPQRSNTKTSVVVECIKSTISCNPFVSNSQLVKIIENTLHVQVSRELVRIAIQTNGFTKKKARFYGRPPNIEQVVDDFVYSRKRAIDQNRFFVSIDETSFGRHGRCVYGYTRKGAPLFVKKNNGPRMTTHSAMVCVSQHGDLLYNLKPGAYKSNDFINGLRSFDLPNGTIVLLDNASIHKTKQMKAFAETAGLELMFVPPYSPWFNPVEGVFSIAKRHFYKYGDIESSMNAVTPMHIGAFFDKSFWLTSAPHPLYEKHTGPSKRPGTPT